ncbi:MAG: glycosyltransferase family 4 protein [Candidatus Peribacteraceae bacterium]|jgi:glycosyltransferase involved in cell wall biosynthesis
METILLISPYWKEEHRWMVSSVKLAELWQRLGYRVVVACMGTLNGKCSPRVAVEKVSKTLEIHRMHDFFFPDPWNYGIAFGFTGYVRKLIQKEKPDVIVANKLLFWTSLSVLVLRLTGKRVIVLTDALVGITWWPRGWIPRICAAIYAWTLGWLILLSAWRVITFHPQAPKILKRLGITKKTQVIPTGIDVSKFEIRNSKFETPDTSMVVTYIGRLESVKGVDDFLAASTELKQEVPELTIQVVGWYRECHPLLAQYEDKAKFLGLRDDVDAILRDTDIFVLPSYSEGLSNALMEAMASGCACIATEVGGNRFLIQNGVSGFLYPPGDREALKAHLRRLVEDTEKRRALGKAARKRIEETFDWRRVEKQYQGLFQEYLQRENEKCKMTRSTSSEQENVQ